MVPIRTNVRKWRGYHDALDDEGMNNADILKTLIDVFHEVFDDDSIEVNPNLTAKDVDEWDSLTHIRLMLSVERAFQIKFAASEIGALKNVGDLIALVEKKVSV
jgi:acyl carrier protein